VGATRSALTSRTGVYATGTAIHTALSPVHHDLACLSKRALLPEPGFAKPVPAPVSRSGSEYQQQEIERAQWASSPEAGSSSPEAGYAIRSSSWRPPVAWAVQTARKVFTGAVDSPGHSTRTPHTIGHPPRCETTDLISTPRGTSAAVFVCYLHDCRVCALAVDPLLLTGSADSLCLTEGTVRMSQNRSPGQLRTAGR
jgi:hypothetical protein